MAKRDKDLYKQLRDFGVRKRVARTAAEAAHEGGAGGRRVMGAVAQELHEAADALEARTGTANAGSVTAADPDRQLREAARATAAKRV